MYSFITALTRHRERQLSHMQSIQSWF